MSGEHHPDVHEVSETHVERSLERFVLAESDLKRDEVVDLIARRIENLPGGDVAVVSLVGGAASGKTILAGKIVSELDDRGVVADVIGTDDYVMGDRAYRRKHLEDDDPRSKYDFELLNQKINEVRRNTDSNVTIGVPTYNEQTGEAIAVSEENYSHQVGKVDVLLVEGDFYEVNDPNLVIYLHLPDRHRLQNRLDRDTQHRSEDDIKKIVENFNHRQKNQHALHTLPATHKAHMLLRVTPDDDSWRYDVFEAKK